jgi:hypothetical protein
MIVLTLPLDATSTVWPSTVSFVVAHIVAVREWDKNQKPQCTIYLSDGRDIDVPYTRADILSTLGWSESVLA